MNNIIVLGKVISKSSIHFDYFDKLKVYFYLTVVEENNTFKVVISEKHIDIDNIDILYKNISVNSNVSVNGILIKAENKYVIIGKDIYVI